MTHKLYRYIILILFCLTTHAVPAEDAVELQTGKEYVVFSTDLGDLVFAMYPDLAPKHVEQFVKLAKSGAYDTTHFFRIIPNFIVQSTGVLHRKAPLTTEQNEANQALPAEFSSTLKHRLGFLSMARQDNDPDSGRSSFSIMLGKAPHLDGKYTIFGELISGGGTINKMLTVPREGETPKIRITTKRAYVITDLDAYYEKFPIDPVSKIGNVIPTEELVVTGNQVHEIGQKQLIAILITSIIVVSLIGFFLFERISKARLLSLLLVNVLICGFILFILLTPEGHKNSWLAIVIFAGLFAMFRLMSNFESKRD